jgi:hypothetical protein
MVSNLVLFCLATYLAAFQKIGRCFPNQTTQRKLNFYNIGNIDTRAQFYIAVHVCNAYQTRLYVPDEPFKPSLMFVS